MNKQKKALFPCKRKKCLNNANNPVNGSGRLVCLALENINEDYTLSCPFYKEKNKEKNNEK